MTIPYPVLGLAAVVLFALGWVLRGVWWDLVSGAGQIGSTAARWALAVLAMVGGGTIGFVIYTRPWEGH